MLDYAEITSIPPLPLWTLLAADQETANTGKQTNVDNQVKYTPPPPSNIKSVTNVCF
jgi:DmX-like protein